MAIEIISPYIPVATAIGQGHYRPWWMQGKIQVGGNPFSSLGLDYCIVCRDEVDTDTEAEYSSMEGVYVYRRRCVVCGSVIKFGAVQVPMITGGKPLPAAALQWITDPGQDRR